MNESVVVNEIFYSLQGESTHAGRPCVLIRLTGCSLRCRYCDTRYAFFEGTEWSIEAVLAQVASFGCPLVEVTGGEPLEQGERAHTLLRALCDAGYEVLLETAGSEPVADVDPRVTIIFDLKTPGSGMDARNRIDALADLKPGTDEVKFVVTDRADFDWAVAMAREHDLFGRFAVHISPSWGQVAPVDAAQWVLESGEPLRLTLQQHKLLWGADTRGV